MFRFKHFIIYDENVAMKVGTDSVLLGAWANLESSKKILDIGTGSGILSLISAQRNPYAHITAIDIDNDAIVQAKENFEISDWNKRLKCKKISLQLFAEENPELFDFIICNPPFFENSLLPTDEKRASARHTLSLTYIDIIENSRKLLNINGKLALIIPFSNFENFKLLLNSDFQICRETLVKSFPHRYPHRVLLEIIITENKDIKKISDEIIIYDSPDIYSKGYKNLCKDFYLKF